MDLELEMEVTGGFDSMLSDLISVNSWSTDKAALVRSRQSPVLVFDFNGLLSPLRQL